MATLRELVTKVSFDVKTEPLERVQNAIAGISAKMNLLVGAELMRGLGFLAGKLDQFGNYAIDLRNTAEAAGIGADRLQKLAYAAAQSGVNQDELGKTLTGLSKKLQEARLGSEGAALAFARANITPEQLGNFKDSEQALYALGRGLNSIKDPILRASAAQETLGEGGMRLLAAMNGTEKGLYALSHSAEAADNSLSPGMLDSLVASQQAMIALKASITTLTAQIIANLAPTIIKVTKAISAFLAANRALISLNFNRFIYAIGYAMGYAEGAIEDVSLAMIQTVRYLDDWGRRSGMWGAITKGFDLIGQAAAAAWEVIKWVYDQIIAAIVDVILFTKNMSEGAADAWVRLTSAIDTATDALKRFGAFIKPLFDNRIVDAIAMFNPMVGLLQTMLELLTGTAFENTWLGKMIDAGKSLPALFKFGSNLVSGKYDDTTLTDVVAPGLEGSTYRAAAMDHAIQAQRLQTASPSGSQAPVPGAQDPSARINYTVEAPVTINVSGAADPQRLYDAVQNGVSDHHDKVLRQSQATLNQAVLY